MKDYKKILEGVVDIINATEKSDIGFANICTYIGDNCPELKESEDERIRKELIATFQNGITYNQISKARAKDYIAWIEKQGKNNMGISEATKKKLEDNLHKALEKETPESWNEFLDKQGEQKPAFEMKTPEESLGIDSSTYNKIVDECIYGEQKPADKVEPKFKAEDWISGYYTNYKVLSVNNNGYVVEDVDGNKINILFENEKFHHLWTIQDAKDGDVLYCKSYCDIEYIVMSKGVNNHINIDSYFRYNSVDGFGINIPDVLSAKQDNITPATQEQRDLLFQKMHEAGYKWDAELKQLKKIEQKPAWSEEDEKMIDGIIEASIHHCYLNITDIEWLKSLKDRVQPQNKWKESLATADLENSLCDIQDGFSDTSYEYRILGEAIEFIRCTEPKPQWKPSDEQIKALAWALSLAKNCGEESVFDLRTLHEQLKKLREE